MFRISVLNVENIVDLYESRLTISSGDKLENI